MINIKNKIPMKERFGKQFLTLENDFLSLENDIENIIVNII